MASILLIVLSGFIALIAVSLVQRYRKIQLGRKLGLDGPKPDIFFGNLLELVKVIYLVNFP